VIEQVLSFVESNKTKSLHKRISVNFAKTVTWLPFQANSPTIFVYYTCHSLLDLFKH